MSRTLTLESVAEITRCLLYTSVRCHGTKVSGYSTARENVTVTNHYDVRRAGTVRFERCLLYTSPRA